MGIEIGGIETTVFLFGAILFLIGILGGGFEIKELKIPKVDRTPRILAIIAGLFFIILGIGLAGTSTQSPPSTAISPSAASVPAAISPPIITSVPTAISLPKVTTPTPIDSINEPVDVTIYDELTPGAISEQILVSIDGRDVGTLTANTNYPRSKITVTVPNAGKYSYLVSGAIDVDIDGKLYTVSGAGEGMIDVKPGKSFWLYNTYGSGGTLFINLLEKKPPNW